MGSGISAGGDVMAATSDVAGMGVVAGGGLDASDAIAMESWESVNSSVCVGSDFTVCPIGASRLPPVAV